MIEWLVLGGGTFLLLFFTLRGYYRHGVKVRDESYLRARKSGATHDQAVEYARQVVNEMSRQAAANYRSSQLESEALRYYERKNREGS